MGTPNFGQDFKRKLARSTEERDLLKRPPRTSPRVQDEVGVYRRSPPPFFSAPDVPLLQHSPNGFHAWIKNPLRQRKGLRVSQTA